MDCDTLRPEDFDINDTPPPPPGGSICVPLASIPEWLERWGYEVVDYKPSEGFIVRKVDRHPSAAEPSGDRMPVAVYTAPRQEPQRGRKRRKRKPAPQRGLW